jgi:hypothetical protein
MSALPPKADIGFLFDHVVGLRKQRLWDRYAERLSRLEIDHQLVLGWRLHGKIGGLLAFEDAIDVTRGTPVLVDKINAIRDQSAAGDIKSVGNVCPLKIEAPPRHFAGVVSRQTSSANVRPRGVDRACRRDAYASHKRCTAITAASHASMLAIDIRVGDSIEIGTTFQ